MDTRPTTRREGHREASRTPPSTPLAPSDHRPGNGHFLTEVVEGLSKARKELPSKYFYDQRGARLFEEICNLEEYYIPRTETAIMNENAAEMAYLLGDRLLLLEFGSGDCAKTRILLDHLHDPAGFVPIDISFEQLSQAASQLSWEYPSLEVLPVCADFTCDFELPHPSRQARRRAVYFPGSTLGNFDPLPARRFLERMGTASGPGGALLIGIDLKKEPSLLHRAYNDARGVTSAFNMNLLRRINVELGADFNLERFGHYAFYNPSEGRVEMHLVSLTAQEVHVGDKVFRFTAGESIWTESSYKYTPEEFSRLAASAGLRVERTWMDARRWFSVHYLVNLRGTSSLQSRHPDLRSLTRDQLDAVPFLQHLGKRSEGMLDILPRRIT